MSLIQEALKRQEQEFGDGKTPAASPAATSEPPVTETMPVMAAPPSMAEAPPPSLPPPLPLSARSSRPGSRIIGMAVAALVILVVGGFLTVKWTLKMMAQKTAVPILTALPTAQPMAVPPERVAALTNGIESASSPPPAAATPDTPASQSDLPTAPASNLTLASVTLAAPSREAASPAQQVSAPGAETAIRPTQPRPAVKAPPAPLQWPTLKLTGLLASLTPGEGAARINNEMIFVGGQVEGVTLAEIRSDGVLLKYGNETKFLKMGGVLY